MRAALLALALLAAPVAAQARTHGATQPTLPPLTSACAPDAQIMMLQDYATFDQSDRGWRSVAQQPDCEGAAADLIAHFRTFQANVLGVPEARALRLHEGQVRADLGQTEAALTLLAASHDAEDPASPLNPFVDATIAFLKHDRAALTAARETLAAAPRPADFDAMAAAILQQTGRQISWPPNLDRIDAFVTCFDRSYRDAMSDPACRA